jgi:formamidopyrimidine-DNA glycosylase
MPELPEVETTRRGIAPWIQDRVLSAVTVRNPKLRQPIPVEALQACIGQSVLAVKRRGKYLIVSLTAGSLLIHLGMSGSLRIVNAASAIRKHDHCDLIFTDVIVRFHDPRRFGLILWTDAAPEEHPLLAHLGPEPLTADFDSDYLFTMTRRRRVAIKNLLMNSQVVVGVGNIYASESLFLAGIRPTRQAQRVTRQDCVRLVAAIKLILERSITQGGTSLRDFVNENGAPGYFAQALMVYGREAEACKTCGKPIRLKVIGQRSSFYCSQCQK